jgi:hypothetical protein
MFAAVARQRTHTEFECVITDITVELDLLEQRTAAALTIQKFYRTYIKEQDYSSYGHQPAYDCDDYDFERDYNPDYEYHARYPDPYNDSDDGMYSLLNGGSTDDWETYIDNVYN